MTMPQLRIDGVTLHTEYISEGGNYFLVYEGVAGWICRKRPNRESVGTPLGFYLETTENVEFLSKYMPKTAALLRKAIEQAELDDIISGG
jgi:hypothetical protein